MFKKSNFKSSVDAAWNGFLIVIKFFLPAVETFSFLLRRYTFKHPRIQNFGSGYALCSILSIFLCDLECCNACPGEKVPLLLKTIILLIVK